MASKDANGIVLIHVPKSQGTVSRTYDDEVNTQEIIGETNMTNAETTSSRFRNFTYDTAFL